MISLGEEGLTPRQRASQISSGLGLMEDVIIDQHFDQRGRYGRLLSMVAASPNLLGMGIDENTAAEIRNGRVMSVIGGGAIFLVNARNAITDAPDAVPVDESRVGHVAFDDVVFAYNKGKVVLPEFDLHIPSGQTIALVGSTGAGKSTLAKLMARFYDPTQGSVKLDGVDLRDLDTKDMRRAIVMVTQEAYLFSGTVADNIALGKPDATLDEIKAAAKAVGADAFIEALPDGYDTVIDDEGSNVSAGEKQLITIARAFLADPTLLILDEATSSVDTRTELLLQRAMAALRTDRTSFVIAHRLSTIRDADLILVMESGRIVEQGTHDELVARGGAYAALYESQFAGAAATPD